MIDAAAERGELPVDLDSRQHVVLVAAPIYYRKFVTQEPLDYAVADRAAATAIIAVRAWRMPQVTDGSGPAEFHRNP